MEQQNTSPSPQEYALSLFEVCEILGKSSRTVSRYVHRNILHPVGIKSRQGTLEYRFSRTEVDVLKQREEQMRQYNYMPQSPHTRQGMATFATMNYPQVPVMQRTPFAIPDISYPVIPSQAAASQPASPAQSYQDKPQPAAAPTDSNHQQSDAGETTPSSNNQVEPSQNSLPAQDHNNEQIIILLKETTEMLRDQLQVKDGQIKSLDEKIGQLIERNRETNILLKGLQDKMVLLEKPKNERKPQSRIEPSPVAAEDVVPSASPAPRVSEAAVNSIKVKVVHEDNATVGQDSAYLESSSQNLNKVVAKEAKGGVRESLSRSDGQTGRGFFGKIFG